jgi:hypothetical protein
MVTEPPLSALRLAAGSVADDAGFVALADVGSVLAGRVDTRVIGGHMVQLHVQRWLLGAELYRETQDADLGIPVAVAQDPALVTRLGELGYERVAGNRFGRSLDDVPVRGPLGEGDAPQALIDVLVPAFTNRPRQDRKFGDHLVTTEVLGLAEAFRRAPIVLDLELRRLNGVILTPRIAIPDEAAAMVLKVRVWGVRGESKDAVDIWRCSEVALAAGVMGDDLEAVSPGVVDELRRAVRDRNGPLVAGIVAYRGISQEAGDVLHTRLVAVVERITSP